MEKLLIIDDIAVHRMLIVSGLRKIRPCEIVEAASMSDAKTILEKSIANQETFHAILCDWNMPDADGGTMVDWVRDQPSMKNTPFIMISGNNHIEDIIRAFMEYDIDAYVVKPFLPVGLNDKITGAIRRRHRLLETLK